MALLAASRFGIKRSKIYGQLNKIRPVPGRLECVAYINNKPVDMLGHVTSSYYSPNLNKSIALAVVRSGKKMKGQKLIVPMENKNINVTVSDFIFLDKENKRLNA